MKRPRTLEARYGRILAAGLGISAVVHGALLGLTRISLPTAGTAPRALTVVEAPEPPVDPPAVAVVTTPEIATAAALPSRPQAVPAPSSADVPRAADVWQPELTGLALSSGPLGPVVPRPRIRPERVPATFTPVHTVVQRPGWLAVKDSRPKGGAGGIRVTIGRGGICAPTSPASVVTRLTNRQAPVRLRMRSPGSHR